MNETLEELLSKNQIPEEISTKMMELYECLNQEGRAKMLELLARD